MCFKKYRKASCESSSFSSNGNKNLLSSFPLKEHEHAPFLQFKQTDTIVGCCRFTIACSSTDFILGEVRREQQQKRNFCVVFFPFDRLSFLAYFLTRYKNISTQQKEKEDGVIHDDDENDDEVEMRGLQTSRLRM
jgi:hypothetical protein